MQDPLRFQRDYNIPPGRSTIAKKPLDHLYRVEKVLDSGGRRANAIGGLNNGVFLVRHIKSGKRCVQKCIPTDNHMASILEREILLLQVLKHPNVVEFVAACITDTVPRQMSLYMEYYDVGSLHKIIGRYRNHSENHHEQRQCTECLRVPEAFVWHILHSLASALQYLHFGIEKKDRRDLPRRKSQAEWPPILHRDIKPDNILLRTAPEALSLHRDTWQPLLYPHWPFNTDDPKGSHRVYPQVVLADFGLASQYHEPDFNNPDRVIGTPHFSAPEPPINTSGRGDVWALGASVLSLCRLLPGGPIGDMPPRYPNPREWHRSRQRHVSQMGPGDGYSEELKRILADSLMFRMEDRVKSWELMREVRKRELALIPPRGKGLKVRLLPEWVYGA